MKFLIHACPDRLWYVNNYLIPSLRGQGAAEIRVWTDTEHAGNLRACMAAFASCDGDGGTWHLQDDVLICSDFVKRCADHDEGLIYGFACANFDDRLEAFGRVYVEDAWHSFQCVRIPDRYARECAEWVLSEAWRKESGSAELPILWQLGKGDDTFFHEFIISRYGWETAYNARPNLVEHVDFVVGGSVLHPWRDYLARAAYWDEPELVQDLKRRMLGNART